MSDLTYAVPAQQVVAETEVLKSRFIAVLDQVTTREAMTGLVADCRARYPGASHYCWAFAAGAPGRSALVGQSDDGEPHGTAGEPMLNVLLHSELGEAGVVVVRYFGGTKLGKGGLARAYAEAVKAVLAEAPHRIETPTEWRRGTLGYAEFNRLQSLLTGTDITLQETRFGAAVDFSLTVPVADVSWLDEQLAALKSDRLHDLG